MMGMTDFEEEPPTTADGSTARRVSPLGDRNGPGVGRIVTGRERFRRQK